VLTGVFSFFAGTLLIILPWSAVWDNNHFLQLWPLLETILLSTPARIAVTALGVADFVLGFTEIRRLDSIGESGDSAA